MRKKEEKPATLSGRDQRRKENRERTRLERRQSWLQRTGQVESGLAKEDASAV